MQRGEPVLGLMDDDERKGLRATPAPRRAEGPAPIYEVSVVLPARDEEVSLRECLQALLVQSEPGFALGRQWELIVVNDGSSDQTRAIAEQMFAAQSDRDPQDATGLVLLDAPTWSAGNNGPGMTGKSAACWMAAQRAQGAWLLFTDADTIHQPGSISRSLREAERHEVAMLSYSPRQIVTGFAQRTAVPLIFAELASVYPPAQVNDPGRPIAAANGQFLLVERDAYFDAGGHRAAGMSVVEDVAIARSIKRSGKAIRLRSAPEFVATRMYRSFPELAQGWSKNLASLLPSPVALALWRLLDILLLAGLPLLAIVVPHLIWWQRGALWLIWARTLLRFYSRVARAHAGAAATALSVLGLPLFIYLLLRSTYEHRVRRDVVWKGRHYNPNRR